MDLYLSDLHLGNPLFDSRRPIINLVEDDRFDRIYFTGDIIDVWEGDFYSIREQYSTLISAVNDQIRKGKEVKIVRGNHDPDEMMLKYAFPQAKVYKEKIIEGDTIVIHGNEFDGAILRVEWLNKLLYYLFVHPLLRFKYDIRVRLRKRLTSVSARRDKRHYDKLVTEIEKDAVAKYGKDFKYIVMGHTHFPKIVNCEGGCQYINCGDWMHNHSYVIKDKKGFKLTQGEDDDIKFKLGGKISGD